VCTGFSADVILRKSGASDMQPSVRATVRKNSVHLLRVVRGEIRAYILPLFDHRASGLPLRVTRELCLAGMCQKWKEGTPAMLAPQAPPCTASADPASWPAQYRVRKPETSSGQEAENPLESWSHEPMESPGLREIDLFERQMGRRNVMQGWKGGGNR
jgi:hypothetical protein